MCIKLTWKQPLRSERSIKNLHVTHEAKSFFFRELNRPFVRSDVGCSTQNHLNSIRKEEEEGKSIEEKLLRNPYWNFLHTEIPFRMQGKLEGKTGKIQYRSEENWMKKVVIWSRKFRQPLSSSSWDLKASEIFPGYFLLSDFVWMVVWSVLVVSNSCKYFMLCTTLMRQIKEEFDNLIALSQKVKDLPSLFLWLVKMFDTRGSWGSTMADNSKSKRKLPKWQDQHMEGD